MSTTVKSITDHLHSNYGSFLTTDQLSEVLHISVPSLKQHRYNGMGVPYVKVSRFVRYLPQTIAKYMIKNEIKVK